MPNDCAIIRCFLTNSNSSKAGCPDPEMSARMMMNLLGQANYSTRSLVSETCPTGGLQGFLQNSAANDVSVNYIWNLFYKDLPPPASFGWGGYQDCPDGSETYAVTQAAAVAGNTLVVAIELGYSIAETGKFNPIAIGIGGAVAAAGSLAAAAQMEGLYEGYKAARGCSVASNSIWRKATGYMG